MVQSLRHAPDTEHLIGWPDAVTFTLDKDVCAGNKQLVRFEHDWSSCAGNPSSMLVQCGRVLRLDKA